jgi:DNA-binding response OmpR family regulator
MGQTVLGVVKLSGNPDEPCVLEKACEVARVSFNCQSVPSAEEGIKYMSGAGQYADRTKYPVPSLVLLDLEIDGKEGWRVLSWIRGQTPFRYLPVVVLSSSKSQNDMKRAYDLGASSYLLKPPTSDALVEVVRVIDRYWLTLNQTPAP